MQVANFDMVEQEEEPPAEQQQQPSADTPQQQQPADAETDEALNYDPAATELHKSQQQFWAAILGERPAEQQGKLGLATQQLGQRRARQTARYIFYDSESETEGASGVQGSDEEQQQQQQDGDHGGKRRRKRAPGDDDDELYQADEQVCGRGCRLWSTTVI